MELSTITSSTTALCYFYPSGKCERKKLGTTVLLFLVSFSHSSSPSLVHFLMCSHFSLLLSCTLNHFNFTTWPSSCRSLFGEWWTLLKGSIYVKPIFFLVNLNCHLCWHYCLLNLFRVVVINIAVAVSLRSKYIFFVIAIYILVVP